MIHLNRQGLILSSLMLAALVAVVAGPIHRFLTTWQPLFLVGACFLVALEAGVIHHAFRKQQMWVDEFLRYVVPELFVMLILMRLATTLGTGAVTLADDARRWLYDPLSIFDIPFLLAIIVGFVVGLLAHLIMRDLLELEPRAYERSAGQRDDSQVMLAIARQDRAAALARISTRFVLGGVLLLFALGVEAVNIERITAPGLPLSALSSAAALIYFVSGFLLYSQARLALLRTRWRIEGARVADSVPQRWTRISWLIIAGVVGVAALLPRSYGLGLLATLQHSLGLLGYAIVLIGYVLTSVLSLLAILPILLISLLTGGNSNNGRLPPIEPLAPPPEPPAAAAAEPRLWAALVFWICMLLLAVYAFGIVLQRNPGLMRALTTRGPLAWLLMRLAWLWRDTRSWAGQATERARALLRRQVALPQVRIPALRLGRLAPRELVRYFYRSTLRRAANGGLPRRANQTPYEYGATLAGRLPEAEHDIAELTDSFVLAEYSPRPIGEADAKRVRRPWERLRRRLRELSGGKDLDV
jgi:hypothetical protein